MYLYISTVENLCSQSMYASDMHSSNNNKKQQQQKCLAAHIGLSTEIVIYQTILSTVFKHLEISPLHGFINTPTFFIYSKQTFS